jgi:hypothetical protein
VIEGSLITSPKVLGTGFHGRRPVEAEDEDGSEELLPSPVPVPVPPALAVVAAVAVGLPLPLSLLAAAVMAHSVLAALVASAMTLSCYCFFSV